MASCTAFAQTRSFRDKDLTGQSMVGANLPGADFSGANLHNTDLSKANLAGAVFRDADLRSTIFGGANLADADFRDALMPYIAQATSQNFQRCNMEGLDLKGASVVYSNFGGANLRNTTNWGMVSESSFRGADLRGANLGSATAPGFDMSPYAMQFSGAIYDASTNSPNWIDPERIRARRM
ncbi:pentapeptide repeat-containing protein [Methylobacterium sp. P31]